MKKVLILGPDEDCIAEFAKQAWDDRCIVVTCGFNWRTLQKWNDLIFVEDFPVEKVYTWQAKVRRMEIHTMFNSEKSVASAMKYGYPGKLPVPADDFFGNNYFYRCAFWTLLYHDPDLIGFWGFKQRFTNKKFSYLTKKANEERCKLVKLDNLTKTLDLEYVDPTEF